MGRRAKWRQCQDRGYDGTFGLFCIPQKEYFQLRNLPVCNFTRPNGNYTYGEDNETLWNWMTCCCYKEPITESILGFGVDEDGTMIQIYGADKSARSDIPYFMNLEAILRTSCLTLFLLVILKSTAMKCRRMFLARQVDTSPPRVKDTREEEGEKKRTSHIEGPSGSNSDRDLNYCWSFTIKVVSHDLTLLSITLALGISLYPMFIDRWNWLDVFPFTYLDLGEKLSFVFLYLWMAMVMSKIVQSLFKIRRLMVRLT